MDIEGVGDPGHRLKRCIVIAIDGARGDYLEGYEAPWMRKLAAPGGGSVTQLPPTGSPPSPQAYYQRARNQAAGPDRGASEPAEQGVAHGG